MPALAWAQWVFLALRFYLMARKYSPEIKALYKEAIKARDIPTIKDLNSQRLPKTNRGDNL